MKTFKEHLEENRLASLAAAAGMIAGAPAEAPKQEITKDSLVQQLKKHQIFEPIRAEFEEKQKQADSMSPVSGRFTSDRWFPSVHDPDLVIRGSPADKRGLSQHLMPRNASDVFVGTSETQNPLRGIEIALGPDGEINPIGRKINRMSFNPIKNWEKLTRDINGIPLSGSKLKELIQGDEELAKGIDTRPRETLDLNKLEADVPKYRQMDWTGLSRSGLGGLYNTGIKDPETGDSHELMIKRFRHALRQGVERQIEHGVEVEQEREEREKREKNLHGEVG